MKFYIALELVPNGEPQMKGEELDAEIESQVEGIAADGWEVKKVTVSRTAKDSAPKIVDDAAQLRKDVAALAALCNDGKGNEPSAINERQTNFEMLAWQTAILLKA